MKEHPFELRLRSSDDGSFTQVWLCGSVAAPPPRVEIEQLLALLTCWGGSPVELVLSADSGSVAWFELWGDTVAKVPAPHLQIRFIDSRRHRRGGRDAAR